MTAALTGGAPRVWLNAADRYVLRMALGATLGFAGAMLLDLQFSFLAPMLAISMLIAPAAPGLRQGLGLPLLIYVATHLALTATVVLQGAPLVLMSLVGLVLFASFYAHRRGVPQIVTLLIQISFCFVSLFSSFSHALAVDMSKLLRDSALAAVGIAWICHAVVPAPPVPARAPPPPAVRLPPPIALRAATSDVLVLLPLLVFLMLGQDLGAFVTLMVTINVLNTLDAAMGVKIALARLVGTALGGAMAVVVQQFVLTADTLTVFFLAVFAPGLWFARRILAGGPAAVAYNLAFSTFLLLLGIAVTPVPGGSEENFVLRVLRIMLASLYALGFVILLSRLRRAPAGPA